IERRAGAHRLADAERNRDEIGEEKGPHAEADRHRQLFLDELPYVLVLKEAPAKIKARELANHLDKARRSRLVEAVEFLDFLYLRRVHALTPAIRAGPGSARSERAFGAALAALQLVDHLLDRSAGHELDDDEGDEKDPEQRRDHQQQPLQDVRHIQRFLHQAEITQSSGT